MKFTLEEEVLDVPGVVHQLVEQDGRKSPWVVYAKCGYQRERRTGDPLWPEFTGWHSRVTCPECLSR